MANYANCNWWQYSKKVYKVGRTVNMKPFNETERAAALEFIAAFVESRKGIAFRLENAKIIPALWEKQNDYNLGKAIQLVGRQLKVVPPTEAEKEVCDAFLQATALGRVPSWGKVDKEDASTSASTPGQEESSSTSESTSESASASASN